MTDPASVKPGEVWAVEPPKWADGTWIGIRYGHGSRAWWLESTTDIQEHEKVSDDDVVLLHRLVPARPVTRDDLPSVAATKALWACVGWTAEAGVAGVLNAVVEHLNARGGVPSRGERQDVAALGLAFEAEQATDPVEELAEKIESATRAAIRQVCDDLAGVAPTLDPLAVEQAMEVTAVSRKVAAHALGQEEARNGVDR